MVYLVTIIKVLISSTLNPLLEKGLIVNSLLGDIPTAKYKWREGKLVPADFLVHLINQIYIT